jgi:hypothetical protein
MQRWRSLLLVGLAFVVPVSTASAAVITYSTADNSTLDGHPIDASATFTTTDGGLTLLLENLGINPTSVIQNLSGIQFTVTDATNATLTSSAGTPRTIANGGTFIDGPAGSTDWLFAFAGTHIAPAVRVRPPRIGVGAAMETGEKEPLTSDRGPRL